LRLVVHEDLGLEEPIYLMSIKPQYARAIFAGRKKYELRRLRGVPPIEEGSVIVVYVSGRIKSIVGEFRAARVIEATPEKVWSIASRPGAGIGEDAWNYIKGAGRAMAIEVGERYLYERPVTLEEIRRIIPGWNPPFSYKRLSEGDPLLELIISRLREKLMKAGGSR
jgi:predicted transcriptional regulator